MDGRTKPTSTKVRSSIPSVTNWTDWWTEWTDGSRFVSVHQSVHSVHHTVANMDGKYLFSTEKWTDENIKKFDISVRPFFYQKTEISVYVWWTEWTDWWTNGRTEKKSDPSVHSTVRNWTDWWTRSLLFWTDFMDGRMDGRWWSHPLRRIACNRNGSVRSKHYGEYDWMGKKRLGFLGSLLKGIE